MLQSLLNFGAVREKDGNWEIKGIRERDEEEWQRNAERKRKKG